MLGRRRAVSLRWTIAILAILVIVVGVPFLFAQEERQKVTSPNFTGTIYIVKENSDHTVAHLDFQPGAHTRWHCHEGGQIILCEEGVCRTQISDQPVIELHMGQTTYVPPGMCHWQGASPTEGGTQFNVERGKITWLEEVTEAQYHTPPGMK